MEENHPFSGSDVSGLYYPAPEAAATEPLPPAEVEALSLHSRAFGALRRDQRLAFLADARIKVRSSGGTPVREVPVHRCVLSARSSFFREKFAAGEAAVELGGQVVEGFEVGYEALEVVIEYLYTGRLGELPGGVVECVDDTCRRHEACWPAVDFMLQVLHTASTFEIYELVSLFQRRLLEILEKVATDDILLILTVAELCNKHCQILLVKCIEVVVKSNVDYITLEKKLSQDVVKQIVKRRSNLGLDGQRSLGIPNKITKDIYRALDTDDTDLVKMLLNEKHITVNDAKALHYAVAYCHLKVTKELLDLPGADVNDRDHRNYTLLHIAAMRKEPKLIMSLLTRGAQPLHTTSDGRTALQITKRLTRSIETSPRERLCIEMLEQAEMKNSHTEVTYPVEMISDDLLEKLNYLEIRVRLPELCYPEEVKTAMDNADVDGTLKFKSSNSPQPCAGNKRPADNIVKSPLKMTEENVSRMEALYKTVELGMRFFPRCSSVLSNILDHGLEGLTNLDLHLNTEELKNRFNEIMKDVLEAFTLDKKEFDGSASVRSSKSAGAVRSKVAKK